MKNKAILGIFLLLAAVIMSSSALAVKDIDIQQDSLAISGNSGDHLAMFHVRNLGDEVVNVSLVIDGQLTGPGGTIAISNLNLEPSTIPPYPQMGIAQFTVNLNNAVMGQYTGEIRAQIQDHFDSDTISILVDVTDNGQSFTLLSPPINTTETSTTVYQTAKLQNNANHGMTVQIAKQGYDGMTFNVNPIGSISVPAFGTVDIISSVEVPATKAAGMYYATVNATSDATTRTANLGINVLASYKASVSSFTISDVDPGERKAVSFNIQNTGNMALSGISIANFTLTDNDGDRINVTFSPSAGISIAAGSSVSVNADADVSYKMDPGTYSAQVTLGGVSTTFTLGVEVNSLLKVTDVEFDPDEGWPGEEFDVEITIENLADKIDMEDVEIEVFIMDGSNVLEDEDGDDIKDDMDIGDLDAGDEEKVTFTFRVPWNAEDGDSYGIKIVLKGENADDSSEKYEDVYTDDGVFEVNRDKDKVEIYEIDLDSSTLSCVKTTYIDVSLRNIGSNDQEVILTIKNDQLGIREQEIFDMSSDYDDDEFEVSVSKLLDFSSAPAGSYPITVLAENDDGDKLGSDSVTVTVQDCVSAPATTTPTTTAPTTASPSSTTGTTSGTASNVDVVYTRPTDVLGATVPAISAAPVVSKMKSGSVFDSTLGMAMLILGNLLLVVLVIVALVYLLSGSASKGGKREQF